MICTLRILYFACLGGPCRLVEYGYHISRIPCAKPAQVDLSRRGGYVIVDYKREQVGYGSRDLHNLECLENDHICFKSLLYVVVLNSTMEILWL